MTCFHRGYKGQHQETRGDTEAKLAWIRLFLCLSYFELLQNIQSQKHERTY